ncbi:MAG: tetratricopeptide repeat protein [Verrucomicrobiales bacterium]|nr:tetratricopeptide repeat protein [Verrucomicrobiales bacterium]
MTIPELQSALDANPENWELRLTLVQTLVAEGRHDAAVEIVNNGQALPREPAPWLDAAKCYAAVGALEQARGLIASSLEIDPAYGPSLTYQQEIEQQIAAAAAPVPVALSADDIDEEVEEASPPPPSATIVEALKAEGGSNDPIALPKVSFSSDEMDALHAAELEAKRLREASIKRDKYNSIIITVLLHVAIFALLISVATKIPPSTPPQIVASSAAEQQEETIDDTTMEKPTVDPTTAVNTAVTDIISVSAESSLSVSSLDIPVADMAMENIVSFNPSMSLGMPTSSESKMMFGQEMEGEVLGVVLDVSGSMAEYLPMVVREVDKNFKDSPVVYLRNMVIRKEKNVDPLTDVMIIVPEEVIPFDQELKTRTPYWFLWHDLPKKAPQRYVDRLIETFKTRPNQFLSAGGRGANNSRVQAAIEFVMEEKIDSLYIFSDFEDFVDEDAALTIGQMLGRRKIRTYIQPAEKKTESLSIVTNKIANRTLGRQLPTLVSILSGGDSEEKPTSLLPPNPKDKKMATDIDFTYATPRPEITSKEFYGFRPAKGWNEIHRIVEPEYEAVFYGPQANAFIFLKDNDGNFIQNPIHFDYHSWKYVPDAPDPRSRLRRRKFLRLQEEPSFDGKEIVWKMVLEDEVKFDVHLYLGRKGMNATYVAEFPEDKENASRDWAHIHFKIPALASEKSDRFFGYDFPAEGVKLDDVRAVVEPNELIVNLPRQDRDKYAQGWKELGFEPGYNTRKFDELSRRLPNNIRDMEVKGPSWGGRTMSFRTTSSKILLDGGQPRADTEPWEGFNARLIRRGETRERFTKTEAIEIEIK